MVVVHLVGVHLVFLQHLTKLDLISVEVAPVSSRALKLNTSLDFHFFFMLMNTIGLQLVLGFLLGILPTRRSLRVKVCSNIELVKISKFLV